MDKQFKCIWCEDTGEIDGMGFLDCTHCGAAEERYALNEFIESQRFLLTESEMHWAVHNRAIEIAEKAEPKRRADDK